MSTPKDQVATLLPESVDTECESSEGHILERSLITQAKLALKHSESAALVIARKALKPIDTAKRAMDFNTQFLENLEEGDSIPAAAAGTGAGFAAASGMGMVAGMLYKGAKAAAKIGKSTTALGLAVTAVEAVLETETAQRLANDLVRKGVDGLASLDIPVPYTATMGHHEDDYFLGELPVPVKPQPAMEKDMSADGTTVLTSRYGRAPVKCMTEPKKESGTKSEKSTTTIAPKVDTPAKKKVETEELKLKEDRKKVLDAKTQSEAIVSHIKSKPLDAVIAKEINKLVDNLGYSGLCVDEFSSAITRLGGHQRTWRDVVARGTGAYKLCFGWSQGGPLGAIMVFNGLLDMVLGAQENSGHEEIQQALIEIQHILIAGFNHLSKQISENFTLVLERLHKISDELERIEGILSTSFKELHIQKLVYIADQLYKGLNGEFKLSNIEIHKYLRDLSTWIDRDSTAKIQTSLLRDSKSTETCLKLLSDPSYNMASLFPFFILQLSKVLTPSLLADINLQELPNISLLGDACEIFVSTLTRTHPEDDFVPTLRRAEKRFQMLNEIIQKLKENEEIWDILFRQYQDYRYKVGRALYGVFSEITLNKERPIEEQLKVGPNKLLFISVLNDMEMRRVLLEKLSELTDSDPKLLSKIARLDRKSDILGKPGEYYTKTHGEFLSSASKLQLKPFTMAVENGANINVWDGWGQAIHYIGREAGKNYSDAIKLMHLLLKSGEELESLSDTILPGIGGRRKYGTKLVYGGGWGSNVLPITWLMNNGYFELGLLFCAQGYDIVMDATHFMNGLHWAVPANWAHYVQYYLVLEMNSEKGMLNKKALRAAYEYYKAIEAGILKDATYINHDCLLWLTCVLGDLKPLKSLGILKANINKALPSCGFTPSMMSISCNNREVFLYLRHQLKANIHVRGKFDVPIGCHPLMYIAMKRKHFVLAKEMRENEAAINKELLKELEEGLKTGVSIPVTESPVASIITMPNTTVLLIEAQMKSLATAITYLSEHPKPKCEVKPVGALRLTAEPKTESKAIKEESQISLLREENTVLKDEITALKAEQAQTNLLLKELLALTKGTGMTPMFSTAVGGTGTTSTSSGSSSGAFPASRGPSPAHY